MQHCIILNANKAVGWGIFRRFSNLDKHRPEATGDVISGKFVRPVILDKCVKCHNPSWKCYQEILPEAVVGGGISDSFPYNFRLKEDNDFISGTAVDSEGTDVCVKFGDSRSDVFRDIRGADFVSNERTERKSLGRFELSFRYRRIMLCIVVLSIYVILASSTTNLSSATYSVVAAHHKVSGKYKSRTS